MKGTDRPGGVHCGDGKEGRMREDEKRSRSGTESNKARREEGKASEGEKEVTVLQGQMGTRRRESRF
ncbi:hypothetical protein BJX68DRAFT_230122 [Aspergillus pseudodeflectus]|uniref:Uncharacterized protein n=1 Tax=Aspergillus pseudodeflectus TaxID=176178 RepID=A0ABR4KV76_9EURO